MYNMDITIGSYKLRLEFAIIIVFLLVVIFGHTMCSCSNYGLLEGFDMNKPNIAAPNHGPVKDKAKEGFANYKTNAGPQFAENNGNFTHLPVSQWSSVVSVGPQNANQPASSDSMDFFKNTQFKPECCPNTYSGSEGCACMSNAQYNTLVSRGGNNVPYSEY
jgi:hypothetical protein